MREQRTHCGNYIEPQFGATHVCSPNDWQCASCTNIDAEKELEAKSTRIEELERQLDAAMLEIQQCDRLRELQFEDFTKQLAAREKQILDLEQSILELCALINNLKQYTK